MAISDYLMTRLGLAAQARELAAQTERERAARQAAQNRQNVAYLDALLQTGMKVPGMIGDIGAAQGAAGIQEATTGLSAGEMAGAEPSEFTRSADIVRPAGVGVSSTLTGAPPPAVTQPATTAAVTQPAPAQTPTSPGIQEVLERASKTKAEAEKRAQEPFVDIPDFTSSKTAAPAAAPIAPPAAKQKTAATVTPQQLEGAFATPSTAQPTMVPTTVRPTEEAGAAIETITVPFLNIPVPRPSARTTPQTPAPEAPPSAPETAAPEVLPSVQEELTPIKKEVEEIAKLEDPFVKAQGEFIKKLNSYQPPKYKVNVQDAADKIVEDTWKNKQPNAILNFLSFGQYNNNLENAKRLAKKMVASEITGLRKQETEGLRKQFIETAKLEAQQLAILQKEQNEKRKMEFKGSLKTLNPEKAVEKLQAYNQVNRDFEELENITRKMIANKIPFPGGKDINEYISRMKAFIAAPTESSAAAVNTSLGALGVGAGGGVSISQGARGYNVPVLDSAIAGLQQAQMDDTAKAFLKQQLLLAQTVGKAREGGRMTDADLKFYVDNLFMDNANKPSALLESINRLKKVNANSQNDWLNIYNSLYPEMNLRFTMLSPAGFNDEELAAADEIGWYKISPQVRDAAQSALRQPSYMHTASSASEVLKELIPPVPPAPAPGAQPPPQRRRATTIGPGPLD